MRLESDCCQSTVEQRADGDYCDCCKLQCSHTDVDKAAAEVEGLANPLEHIKAWLRAMIYNSAYAQHGLAAEGEKRELDIEVVKCQTYREVLAKIEGKE